MGKIFFHGLTIKGRRATNQDNFLAVNINDQTTFLAVADGMGGTQGGEIASLSVLEAASVYLKSRFTENVEPGELKSILGEVFRSCHNTLVEKLEDLPGLSGMGTTLTCLLVHRGQFVWGNIGDSRLYLFREGKLAQLTIDHTMIQDYIRQFGKEIPEQIKKQSNIITRALDGRGDKPDIFPENSKSENCKDGDIFILCSDGMISSKYDEKDISWIQQTIRENKTTEAISSKLVKKAFEAGSTDNITVVAARYSVQVANFSLDKNTLRIKNVPRKIPDTVRNPRKIKKNLWLILGVIIIALCVTFAYYFHSHYLIHPNKKDGNRSYRYTTNVNANKFHFLIIGFKSVEKQVVSLNQKIVLSPVQYPELIAKIIFSIRYHGIQKSVEKDRTTSYITLKDFNAKEIKHGDIVVLGMMIRSVSPSYIFKIEHSEISLEIK